MDALLGVAAIAIIALYMLPTIVAGSRNHHQTGAICVLNLFLGWTLLGWVGALVWAATATAGWPDRPQTPAQQDPRYSPPMF